MASLVFGIEIKSGQQTAQCFICDSDGINVVSDGVVSLANTHSYGSSISSVTCRTVYKAVFTSYHRMEVLKVHEVTVVLEQPASGEGYVQIVILDQSRNLTKASAKNKFSAALRNSDGTGFIDSFALPDRGIRFQSFTTGFFKQQHRHFASFHTNQGADFTFIAGFEKDVATYMRKGDLVFLGDENGGENHVDPIKYAKLYILFHDLVKYNGGRVSICGDASGMVESGSWLQTVLLYLKSQRPREQWVDEWRFHKLSSERFAEAVQRAAQWSWDNGAPMVLASWAVNDEQQLREAIAVIREDNRIIEATFWNYVERFMDSDTSLNAFGRQYETHSRQDQPLSILVE